MTMSYPPQQAYPQYPPPTPPPAPKAKAKTWLWIVGVIGAFIIGVAAGTAGNSGAGSNSAGGTVTVTAPAADAAAAPAENPPPAGPATTMGSGVYQVGVDVQAGQYKTPGPPEDAVIDMCYWARQKDDSGEFESLITNGTLEGPGSVTINDGEFVELTGDCTWAKVG